jgi:hypothetical protein
MISRSTLLGALVVAELAIVGVAFQSVAGSAAAAGSGSFSIGPGQTALDRSFVTGPAPHVVVDVSDVPVVLVADAAPTVHVVETVRKMGFASAPEPATARQTPDGVHISAVGNSGVFVFGGYDRRVRLTVPANALVEVTSGGGIDASGLRQKLVGHLAEGRITIRDHRGDIDVSTGDGAIRLVDVQGSEIAASTRDGRVYLTRVAADRINAHSASGRIVGADLRATDGALTTHDGRIELTLSGNSDAMVSAHTADGRVSVHGFDVMQSVGDSAQFRVGSGRGKFELSTDDGPITITQGASV